MSLSEIDLEIKMAQLVIPTVDKLSREKNDQKIIDMRRDRLKELLKSEKVFGYFDTIVGVPVETTDYHVLDSVCCSGGMPILICEGL
jgi:hypothetical protein